MCGRYFVSCRSSVTFKIAYCHGAYYGLWYIQEYIVARIGMKCCRLCHFQMVFICVKYLQCTSQVSVQLSFVYHKGISILTQDPLWSWILVLPSIFLTEGLSLVAQLPLFRMKLCHVFGAVSRNHDWWAGCVQKCCMLQLCWICCTW